MRAPRWSGLAAALLLVACGEARSRSGGQGPDACTRCHGDAAQGNAAPPRSVDGLVSTDAVEVGAHQRHLHDGQLRKAIACSECHVVPAAPDAPGHMGNTHAVVVFGALATAGGASPIWNREQATCSSTYCHGATLGAGGSDRTPVWTRVDGAQAACDACHGAPPPDPHPQGSAGAADCASCHPDTVKPDGSIDVAGGEHIDGAVQLGGLACTSCHGDATRSPAASAPAPPRDTQGNTATTAPGVGAHQRHLSGGSMRAALQCSDCHAVPTSSAHATEPLDLTWGSLARSGSVSPSWNSTSYTCTNYCHGASLSGGSDTSPTWTVVGGSQAACGTCHGLPPAAGHPTVSGGVTACASCHSGTVTAAGDIDLAGGLHVNGSVDASGGSCTSCHGSDSRTGVPGSDGNVAAAPPVDTQGNTSTSARGVGAHQAHVNKASGALSSPTACAECHVVPGSSGHADSAVNVTFGARARTGGVTPSWNGSTCASTYCHGAFSGGSSSTPSWTSGTMSCTSCHGDPPNTGEHAPRNDNHDLSCSACHGTGYSSTAVNAALHVNGSKNVGGAGSSINSWSSPRCTPTCHEQKNW